MAKSLNSNIKQYLKQKNNLNNIVLLKEKLIYQRKLIKQNKQPLNLENLYYNEPIKIFINLLMKNGKKAKAENILYNSFFQSKMERKKFLTKSVILKKKMDKNMFIGPLYQFNRVINDLLIPIDLVKLPKGKNRRVGKKINVKPIMIGTSRQYFNTIKWIINNINSRKTDCFTNNLKLELSNLYKDKGDTLKKYKEIGKQLNIQKIQLYKFIKDKRKK